MEENIGMVMGFTVISAAVEWLGNAWQKIQSDAEECKRRKKEQEEEEEKVIPYHNLLENVTCFAAIIHYVDTHIYIHMIYPSIYRNA